MTPSATEPPPLANPPAANPPPTMPSATTAPPDQEWYAYVKHLKTRGIRYIRLLRITYSFPVILSAMAGDFLVVLAALLFAKSLRMYLGAHLIAVPAESLVFTPSFECFAAEAILSVILLNLFGGYDRSYLLSNPPATRVPGRACFVWLFLCPGLTLFLAPESGFSRLHLLLSVALAGTFLLLWRRLFHARLARTTTAQRLRKRVLFLGWSPEADRLATLIATTPNHPYEIIGRLSLSEEAPPSSIPSTTRLETIGSEEDLDFCLGQDMADVVVASGPEDSQRSLLFYANVCEKRMVEFKFIPSCFEILVSGLNLETVGGTPLLGISRLPLDSILNVVLKRIVDIVGGLVGLILSAPLILVFGTLIYLEERRRPIFFVQERYGRKGRKFRMYKLRSMRLGSEKSDHLNQSTLREDPRLLRIGAFMRQCNIDEIPQFWNVLVGDMSLVGPRPERTYHSELLGDAIPHYNARYNILPGITGWAQVNGLRGDTDLAERVKCDLHYIERWSLLFDFRILLMTFFKNKNAY